MRRKGGDDVAAYGTIMNSDINNNDMTGITISRLIFNEGTQIDVSPQDIIVFVGPNNMGKSQSLRDIFNSISNDHGSVVISDLNIAYHNPENIRQVIQYYSLEKPNGNNYIYGGYHYNIYSLNIDRFGTGRYVDDNIRKFLVSMVKTEERLTTSSPKQMVNPGESRGYPLQYVTDPENRKRMSDVFEKIFSRKIFCEDRGSTMLTLHMGTEIAFNQAGRTPQEVSDELYRRMASLPKVHEQGDGIRSLAGLLLNMMMPNYTMFLIDEPEAFLHPPQARVLGESLTSLLGERQAFISTHSIELIKGLLSTAGQRVKIIRLTREGDVNPVHYLQPADLDEIWRDPLMRHSNILDGLFYHHTILCESDSDCQLYAAMLSHIKEKQDSYSDTLFTLCNGKGRMKPLSKLLKSLGIDYRIVPDLDFFNDENLVKAVYENCGGVWADIEGDYQTLFNAMNQPDGTMTPEVFTRAVRRMIDEKGWVQMTKPHANRLSKDLPKLLENQWDKLKHNGIDSIQEPAVKEAIERLISRMNEVGVFPVRKGELESLFPNIGSHGPGCAVAVLAQYPDLDAEEHRGLREVVTSWGI